MRIIARKTLRQFWEQPGRRDAEQPLKAWIDEAEDADWKRPQDIKDHYRHASFVGHDRVVFNVAGNKYRLIVAVRYDKGIVYIRFLGTHAEYDKIDAREV